MSRRFVFEVCLDSPESCARAQAGGADRVELCAALMEGGLTPSLGTLKEARKVLDRTQLFVILRPRGGDFCYTDTEFAVMKHDLLAAKEVGADGLVVGILLPDGRVDEARTSELVALAAPLPVTFHRAFDMAADPFEALEAVLRCGCTRILTSGQEGSSVEGADLLAELVRRAGDRIIVMPGGGVRERNIKKLATLTGAREFHFTAFEPEESPMTHRNGRVFMGGTLRPPEFSRNLTSPSRVAAYITQAEG